MKTKISKAQERVLNIMNTNPSPFHFIPWGLNYYHLRDGEHNYLGRVRFCVFDALYKKGLIININHGWITQ